MGLYFIFIFSIPFKNAFWQASIAAINLFFLFMLFSRKEGISFLKSVSSLLLVLGCLAFAMGLASVMGITGAEGWKEVAKHILRFWVLLLATIYFLRRDLISSIFLVWIILFTLFFQASNGMVQFFWGKDFFGNGLWDGIRLQGVVRNPNPYGFLMALGVVFSFALQFRGKEAVDRFFLRRRFFLCFCF